VEGQYGRLRAEGKKKEQRTKIKEQRREKKNINNKNHSV
jgi:hypothetical protein